GWNDGTEQDIFTKDELIEKFSLDRVQKSGARFDEQRLLWLNGQWIRRLELDDLFERIKSFWGEAGAKATAEKQKQVLSLVQDRLKTLADLPAASEYFFARPAPNLEMISSNKQLKKLDQSEISQLLETIIEDFQKLAEEQWDPENIQSSLNNLLEKTGTKPGILFQLIRICATWAPFSPQLNDTLATLGKSETIARLQEAKQLC
ncbi:MAG: hypothetical protein KIG14_01600, partial [Candidatus Sacchiramonaceae bacterium]|nr:hypothetical protein [Candidatus Saccharimonadaceae bacterium]